MQRRWFQKIVTILFIIAVMLDMASPCCAFEGPENSGSAQVELTSTATVLLEQSDAPGDTSTECDHCYCCSRFSSPRPPALNPTLLTFAQTSVFLSQAPPLLPLAGIYRPPRSLSV
jgi:hypothetical protein